ncbi:MULTISPECIES: hypothetical protein [unclassified Pseudomonas]|uniref:hypothetical protein n=1 Tax=unclassified Pseudomonas TaxID=196821 RepID=UPI000C881230|nr:MULTISPECIES: hypothetical protein [unclassified Pseudomonas]PMX19135.1 hypothetical protein C1Y25_00595 [Pseudomonas sp. MPBC4-3]PMX50096.1 hypothetical protein C1Y20_04310 [Pseudomonas sp. FW301-21B01]PMY10812.1 hypothetical protein C1Y18_02140 [Pseudomonas sp. MPR-R5A]PNA72979.1 hypothetical protein C1Y14_01695 [Pseudomonas sp. MPR-R5B]
MSDKNMQIWNRVEKTDTRYTKDAKVGSQQITSLNGTAMIMKATEIFGPVGIGFGWTVLEERFDKGAEMFVGEGDKRATLGFELNHTVKIRFWIKQDGERGEFEQYGCTPYLYKSKYGTTTDGEAPKKSLTDAIKKSLSMLGFSADVFLGMFDDKDYVNALSDEQAIEQAEDKAAEEERQKQERLDYIASVIESLKTAKTAKELKSFHDVAVRRLTLRNDTKAVTRIIREYDEQKARFEQESAA